MKPTLDLPLLTAQLRDAGFKVDTRQFLAAHQLLVELERRGVRIDGDVQALTSHLGPLFCTSPEEQARFGKVVQAHFAAPPPPPPPPPPPTFGVLLRAAIAGLSVVACLLFFWFVISNIPLRCGGKPVPPTEPDTPKSTPASTPASTDPPSSPQTWLRVEAPRTFSPSVLSGSQSPVLDWRRGGLLGVIGGLVVFGLWSLLAWRVRRLVLQKLPEAERPDFVHLDPEPSDALWLEDTRLRDLAAGLRRPRELLQVPEFDARRTAEAAARGAGFSLPLFSSRKTIPHYFFLVQRRAPQDHQARLVEGLLEELGKRHVAVARYTFVEDPRTAFAADGERTPIPLARLLARHHASMVVLVAEARTVLDPLMAKPAHWLADFRRLPRRVLLTPAPVAHWGREELAVEQEGFAVIPLEPEALVAFARSEGGGMARPQARAEFTRPFPPSIRRNPERWLESAAPDAGVIARLLRELRAYLGPSAFTWLAACAAYPEVEWDLTLYLARTVPKVLDGSGGELSVPVHLPRLARLPWFQYGVMPEWLRRTLLTQLTAGQERAVRRCLRERLALLAQRTLARQGRGPDGARGGLRLKAWNPLQLLQTASPESPMRDAVFVGFMAGARIEAPVLEAPGILRRLFRHVGVMPSPLQVSAASRAPRRLRERMRARVRGWVAFRPRQVRLVAACASAALVGVLCTPRVEPPAEPPRIAAVALSPDAKQLVLGLESGVVQWVEPPTGPWKEVSPGRRSPITALAFAPTGNVLAIASKGGGVRLWDVRSGGEPRILRSDEDVSLLRFSAGGERLLGLGAFTARVWDVPSGTSRWAIDRRQPQGARFSTAAFPSADRVLIGEETGEWVAWDVERSVRVPFTLRQGGMVPGEPPFDPGRPAFTSDDSSLLLNTTADGRVLGWDARLGEPRFWLQAGGGRLHASATPWGLLLVQRDFNGRISLHEAQTRELLVEGIHHDGVTDARLSLDGTTLLTISPKEVRLWPLVRDIPSRCDAFEPVRVAYGVDGFSGRVREQLKHVADCVKKRSAPDILLITGHAEGEERGVAVQGASKALAQQVAQYLVSLGVSSSRIETQGAGTSKLLCSETTEACRARNRRVELQWKMGTVERAEVPDLVTRSVSEAEGLLEQARLRLGKVRGQTPDVRLNSPDIVVSSQSPSEGSRASVGSRVDVTVIRLPPRCELTELTPLQFGFNETRLRGPERVLLQHYARCISDRTDGARVIIEGHASAQGEDAYNLVLSNRIAASVKRDLVALGVPASRLETIGYGETRPRCTEDTEACFALNRRVEFRWEAPDARLIDVPDVVGRGWSEARAALEDVGLVAVWPEPQAEGLRGEIVAAQAPSAGARVLRGTKVELTLQVTGYVVLLSEHAECAATVDAYLAQREALAVSGRIKLNRDRLRVVRARQGTSARFAVVYGDASMQQEEARRLAKTVGRSATPVPIEKFEETSGGCEVKEEVRSRLLRLAADYTQLRKRLPSGDERTTLMKGVVARMMSVIPEVFFTANDLKELYLQHENPEGARIAALAACRKVEVPVVLLSMDLILQSIQQPDSPFEQYEALMALIRIERYLLLDDDRARALNALESAWLEDMMGIQGDDSRKDPAQELMKSLRR
ncbi:OmpA family protein [Archangium gephyra]|uniref:OmpA family protein n=1 Tax=Archangium gephyra TaxID=48 RepID=UPI003B828381